MLVLSKLFRFILLLLLLAAAGIGGYYGYQYWQKQEMIKNRPRIVRAKDGTNINAAWFSNEDFQRNLKEKYPYIYKAAFYSAARTYTGQLTIVPGLEDTRSYNFIKKKFDTAHQMTPQGLTIAGKYLLLTAYDGQHDHASVIYVLQKNGKYLKTIQVAGRPHLGGIAYDPKSKSIWITNSHNGVSSLASFSLTALKKYQVGAKYPINYDQQIDLPSMQKASTVTYFDDQLFVGYFNMYGRGKITSYNISRSGASSGSITNNEIKTVNGEEAWSDPSGETSMQKQIQGIAIYDGHIFLSQSYGSEDSKLYIFPISAINNLNVKNAERIIAMPPYLEQIQAYKGQLICLFESGSAKYARPDIMVMDHLLSLNIAALFGD